MLTHLQRGLGQYSAGYVLVKGLPWGGGEDSYFAGASPAVANGDKAAYSPVSFPDSFVVNLSSTGVPKFTAFGSTARQHINIDVYHWATRSWYGPVTDWVNDLPPTVNPAQLQFTYVQNVAINDLLLSAYALDPEGDTYVISTGSTLPPGLSLASNVLTGTPTTLGTYNVTFIATDFLNQATNFPQWSFIIKAVTPPNVPPPAPQNPKVWIANSIGLNASGSPGDWTNTQQIPFHTWTADGWWDPNGVLSTYPRTIGVPPQLGKNVTSRQFSWNEMVRRAWGSEFSAPDHRIYEWSNGRGFDSTDMGTTGIYRKN